MIHKTDMMQDIEKILVSEADIKTALEVLARSCFIVFVII